MKRSAWLLVVLILVGAAISPAQMGEMAAAASGKTAGTVPLGFGLTMIDGEPYYLVNLAPELAFGKLGFGLDLNLRISKSGSIRNEYNSFSDYVRIIRYIRWAQKGDPLYVRFGQLDYSRLGHGFIVYNYRNTASYDLRKTGIELDVNFDKFGLETMYSDFAEGGVLGARGYVKPLKFTSLSKIPVINNLEVGVTYTADLNSNADVVYVPSSSVIRNNGTLSIIGFDVGLPILQFEVIKSTIYFDYAKISNYGHGSAAGIDLHLAGMGVLGLSGKYERRFIGEKFIPAYFNALYEKDRYEPGATVTTFKSKASLLESALATDGYYGELVLSVLNTFRIIGGYQAPIGVDNAGIMHFELDAGNVIPMVQIAAGYDKKNVGQVFTLDENSLMYAIIGYKLTPFMVLSTLYQRTFTKDYDASGKFIGYKRQDRVEPKLSFVFNF
ncbi:MAG: hypothetical protein HY966_00005 [Ignavibacteriales bacterium]|nr:hypothetical protein [Ignavibacteriales bacterium]